MAGGSAGTGATTGAGGTAGVGGASSGTGGGSGTSGTAGTFSSMTGGSGGAGGSSGTFSVAGGVSGCSPPGGSTCDSASDYCSGYPYVPGDRVVNHCANASAGCVKDKLMLFECVDSCGSQVPGTGTTEEHWKVKANCDG
jgi:hypothetical protein